MKAQDVAVGYVFNDLNANGKKDKNEAGIAGVAVSNGVEVVISDSQGKYQLPVGDNNCIFVIKPEGYNVPANANNQPLFYYIHKPKGSPATFKYKGVEPTGKLPRSIDFALVSSPEPEKFTSLVFGDPQPYTEAEVDYFSRGILTEVKGKRNIGFGLSLGDIAGDNLNLHQSYIRVMKQVGIPWYNVMGNHDMNYDAPADSLSDETFESNFGPANYAFNYAKAHVIVLDDILYPDPRGRKGYWGGFRPDQLQFIENDLKYTDRNKLIIIAIHIPLFHENEDSFRDADRRKLFGLLKDFPNVLVMSAHTHLQRHDFYDKEDGWLQEKPLHEYNAGTTSGDWYSGELNDQGVPVSTMRDGTPKGYVFLNVSGNQYTLDYKVAGKSSDYQIAIFNPKIVPANKNTSALIVANFFMGHKSNPVEFRIDNGSWEKMNYVENIDPKYMYDLLQWDQSDTLKKERRPSNPEICKHLWQVKIPTKLPVGEHTIEVRATDLFGRVFKQTSSYRIE